MGRAGTTGVWSAHRTAPGRTGGGQRASRPEGTRRRAVAGLACATALVLGCGPGCASLDERRSGARAAAVEFERALRSENGAALCAALAPPTREEVAESARTGCPEAVLDEDLPQAGEVREVDVHGRRARVVLDGDTLFLSRFSSEWRVVAAGCTPRPERPYHCTVKGE